MFLININDILYVWNIHYDIFSTSCIEKMSIYNKYKDSFVYMWCRKMSITGIDTSIFLYISNGNFSIHNKDLKVVYMIYGQIFRMQYIQIYVCI